VPNFIPIRFETTELLADHSATQHDWLLASSCRPYGPSVCHSEWCSRCIHTADAR